MAREALIPEVALTGVEIAGCAMFPGDSVDDPPLILRDLPVIIVAPSFDDLDDDALVGWRHCDLKFGMTVGIDCAKVRVGLYDPYLNFQVNLPLPDFQEQVAQMLLIGWVGIRSEDGEGCLVIRTKPEE